MKGRYLTPQYYGNRRAPPFYDLCTYVHRKAFHVLPEQIRRPRMRLHQLQGLPMTTSHRSMVPEYGTVVNRGKIPNANSDDEPVHRMLLPGNLVRFPPLGAGCRLRCGVQAPHRGRIQRCARNFGSQRISALRLSVLDEHPW